MTDLTTLTPVEVDTFLSANWQEQSRFVTYIRSTEKHLESDRARYVKRHGSAEGFEDWYYVRDSLKHAARYRAKLVELRDAARPYEDEYVRRGCWRRYFLVTNSNGHVHRGMDCSTCYPTTTYAWLVDLADCDETAMVEEYGTKACTICFPDAPTLPAWKRHEEAAAAVEAEKAARLCPESGGRSAHYGRLNREQCSTCGRFVPITRGGKFRKHDRKDDDAEG
jgi:hypothetical protein